MRCDDIVNCRFCWHTWVFVTRSVAEGSVWQACWRLGMWYVTSHALSHVSLFLSSHRVVIVNDDGFGW